MKRWPVSKRIAVGRLVFSTLLLLLAVTACQSAFTPPRLATATAQARAAPTATPEPLVLSAPPGTAVAVPSSDSGAADPNPSLTVWIDETSPEHERVLNQMTAEFSQANNVDVELVLVSPSLLPKLMETAVISDVFPLPDIVLHPLEYTMGWAERGILDTAAATTIIDEIGRETFDPDALTLVTKEGAVAAIPSDGYQQLLIYRADWAAELDLEPPDNYDDMLAMAQTISNTQALISGFVIPTEANLVTTQQGFEHIAAANGCQLIGDGGDILIQEPACQEALRFYFDIVHNYSPTGVQTDTSARNAYLAGRTGLIMGAPAILPQLAGLDDDAPPICAECTADPGYLAQNSRFLTHLTGSGPMAQSANWGEIIYLGITRAADPETAAAFARYWFNEGYDDWLAVESERKVPMRRGTADQPRLYIDAWGDQPLAASAPSLRQVFGDDLVALLRDSVAASDRWGFAQGHGDLITSLYEELAFSIVLQEMLSGYFNPDQTLIEAHTRILELGVE